MSCVVVMSLHRHELTSSYDCCFDTGDGVVTGHGLIHGRKVRKFTVIMMIMMMVMMMMMVCSVGFETGVDRISFKDKKVFIYAPKAGISCL